MKPQLVVQAAYEIASYFKKSRYRKAPYYYWIYLGKISQASQRKGYGIKMAVRDAPPGLALQKKGSDTKVAVIILAISSKLSIV